jgi:hypothetical protein
MFSPGRKHIPARVVLLSLGYCSARKHRVAHQRWKKLEYREDLCSEAAAREDLNPIRIVVQYLEAEQCL